MLILVIQEKSFYRKKLDEFINLMEEGLNKGNL